MRDYWEVLTDCYLDYQKGSENAARAIEQASELLGISFDSLCAELDKVFETDIDK